MIRTVRFFDENYKFQFVRHAYLNNKSTAIEILLPDENEVWGTLSTNIYPLPLEQDEIAVKRNYENEEWTQAILDQTDLFEKTQKSVRMGFGQYEIWKIKQEIPEFSRD